MSREDSLFKGAFLDEFNKLGETFNDKWENSLPELCDELAKIIRLLGGIEGKDLSQGTVSYLMTRFGIELGETGVLWDALYSLQEDLIERNVIDLKDYEQVWTRKLVSVYDII